MRRGNVRGDPMVTRDFTEALLFGRNKKPKEELKGMIHVNV